MTEYYCDLCEEVIDDQTQGQDLLKGNCLWCREERVIHKKCGTRIFAMRWVLHTYKVSKVKRIQHLLQAFHTFIFPLIWTISEDGKTASYKLHYFEDWLSCIQYEVECAVRGYWQGYGIEEPEVPIDLSHMLIGVNE